MNKMLIVAALIAGAAFTSDAQGPGARGFDRGPMGPPPDGPGLQQGPGQQGRAPWMNRGQQFRGGPQAWGGRGEMREMMRERFRGGSGQQGPQRGPQAWGRGEGRRMGPPQEFRRDRGQQCPNCDQQKWGSGEKRRERQPSQQFRRGPQGQGGEGRSPREFQRGPPEQRERQRDLAPDDRRERRRNPDEGDDGEDRRPTPPPRGPPGGA